MKRPLTEGWSQPINSNKIHYYRDGRTLCRKFRFINMMQSELTIEGPSLDSSSICAGCCNKMPEKQADKLVRKIMNS